ncbi:uncharacterized protein TNCT_399131 [Trichonephila clavata]|uniref:Uncharacterized protein n=1 Tax=Trichonephila clavata TaxID=2740835 RepID=A0A8X6G4G3_TRICU|nr:uncharacterized protein TNCT_399131 [Trichonephila clavata]
MFWKLAIVILALNQLCQSESNSVSSEILQVDHTNFNESFTDENNILEAVTTEDDSKHFSNSEYENSNPETEVNREQFPVVNDSLTFENLDKERSRDILKDGEFPINHDDLDESNSNDESIENFPQNYDKIYRSLPTVRTGEEYYEQDSLLEKSASDSYDPTRIKKNVSFKEKSDTLAILKPRQIFTSPRKNEHVLMKRVDGLLAKTGHKRLGKVENGNPLFLKEGKDFVYLNSQPSSSPQGIPPISKLSEKSSKDSKNIYDYYPKIQIGFGSIPEDGYGKDAKSNTDQQSIPEIAGKVNDKIVIVKSTESENAYPPSLKKSAGSRKVTIRKHKTMHSVSREEEESIIQKNPHPRLSSQESINLKPQPRSNELPKYHEIPEKKEEVIILVKGTHIPGKNYGPEDDLFGYYKNTYDNLPDSGHDGNFKKEVVENYGPASVMSNGVKYNNHGDGISTQYFINNHPKSTSSFYVTNNEGKKQYIFPPTEFIPKVTGSAQRVKTSKNDAAYNLPEQQPKEQIYVENPQHRNEKPTYSKENAPGTRNQDENQYVAIDPNQLYVDGETGELIKFVYEEDEEKHQTPNTEDQTDEHSSSYLQKDSGQEQYHGNLGDSSNPHDHESEGKSISFEHGNAEYTNTENSDLSVPEPIAKQVKSKHHGQLISETDAQYHVPSKDLEEKSNYHSVPFEESYTTQENPNEDIYNNNNKHNDGSKYVVLCPGHSNKVHNQEDYENKLNTDSDSYPASNSKNVYEQNHNNFKGSSDVTEGYGKTNNYPTPDKNLNYPEFKVLVNSNYENKNYGTELSTSNDFKENGQGHYVETLYEPQTDEETLKNGHFPVLNDKGNENYTKFPEKTDYVVKSYFSKGPHQSRNFKYPKTRKQNQVYFEFTKPQNNYKGADLKQNGSPGFNNVRNHENFRTSLGNLFGHNSGSFSNQKNPHVTTHITSNFQKPSYNKGNEVYISQKDLNELQLQDNYKSSDFGTSLNTFKGSLDKYGGNNLNSGYEIQNIGSHMGVDSFGNTKGLGQLGGYKPNRVTYTSYDTNVQFSSQHKSPKGYGDLKGIQQFQEPEEYVVVEVDDSDGTKGSNGDDSYLLQYQDNFKGQKNGFSPGKDIGGHAVLNEGTTYTAEQPKIRFVVDGGKDKTFHLRRLATTGFHMARGVLPLMYPTSRPRSIKGNLQFGLQISKRTGSTESPQYFIESRSDKGKVRKT